MEILIGSRWSVPVSYGGYTYSVSEQLEEGKYILTCETSGISGNEYFGTLLPLESINNLGEATLTELYIAGEDAESDDSLRQRIIDKLNTTAFGGNIADYRQYVKGLEGIGDCLVIPIWNGGGTVKLLIVTSSYEIPTEAKINEVQTLVDPTQNSGKGYGIAPIGHEVTVTSPTPLELSIEFNVILDTGYTVAGIQQNVENAIKDYIKSVQREWFSQDEVTIYISRLMVAILSVDGIISASSLTINEQTEDITIDVTDEEYPIIEEVIINES